MGQQAYFKKSHLEKAGLKIKVTGTFSRILECDQLNLVVRVYPCSEQKILIDWNSWSPDYKALEPIIGDLVLHLV